MNFTHYLFMDQFKYEVKLVEGWISFGFTSSLKFMLQVLSKQVINKTLYLLRS